LTFPPGSMALAFIRDVVMLARQILVRSQG